MGFTFRLVGWFSLMANAKQRAIRSATWISPASRAGRAATRPSSAVQRLLPRSPPSGPVQHGRRRALRQDLRRHWLAVMRANMGARTTDRWRLGDDRCHRDVNRLATGPPIGVQKGPQGSILLFVPQRSPSFRSLIAATNANAFCLAAFFCSGAPGDRQGVEGGSPL